MHVIVVLFCETGPGFGMEPLNNAKWPDWSLKQRAVVAPVPYWRTGLWSTGVH